MADLFGRLKRRPRLWLGALLAVGAGTMLLAFARDDSGSSETPSMSHVVSRDVFVIQQSFAGRIVPGEQVEILSPSDATVESIDFNFGDRVVQGQVLFRFSEADVWRKTAEAQITYIQAAETAQKLENWDDSPDVRRARRSLDNARTQEDEARRRHDEGQRLFERGLIARTEMEGLASSLRQAGQGVIAAQDELAQTLARGTGSERRLTQLQRNLAASRLQEASVGGAVIVAPRDGIMVRSPTGAAGAEAGGAKVGGKVSSGQSLGTIAAIDGLDVLFRVEEADLALLQVGAPATVTGPGFAGRVLSGHLLSVAGEAEAGSAAERILFSARVRLEGLSPDDAALLRIGMSGHVSLKLYEAQNALWVPVSALIDGGPQVRVRRPDGRIETRGIALGRIGPDRAEVLSGLKAGETVVWSPSA